MSSRMSILGDLATRWPTLAEPAFEGFGVSQPAIATKVKCMWTTLDPQILAQQPISTRGHVQCWQKGAAFSCRSGQNRWKTEWCTTEVFTFALGANCDFERVDGSSLSAEAEKEGDEKRVRHGPLGARTFGNASAPGRWVLGLSCGKSQSDVVWPTLEPRSRKTSGVDRTQCGSRPPTVW